MNFLNKGNSFGYISPAERARQAMYKGAGIGFVVALLLTWIF